jgi:hypothetical protein
MPKRRPPGPSPQNRRRRRRDSGPNLPREPYAAPDEAPPEPPDQPLQTRPAPAVPTGRPMRPTMRRGFVPGVSPTRPAPTLDVDYRYVIQDLRQIGVLAGAGLLILVALSFVLQ